MIKITQTRFQKSHLSLLTLSITVSKNSLKHPNHSLSHLNTQTLTLKHSPPSNTETLTLPETIPSLVATHSDTQTFTLPKTLLSSATRKPSVKIPLILLFCLYPFVKIPPCLSPFNISPTKVQIFSIEHPSFNF